MSREAAFNCQLCCMQLSDLPGGLLTKYLLHFVLLSTVTSLSTLDYNYRTHKLNKSPQPDSNQSPNPSLSVRAAVVVLPKSVTVLPLLSTCLPHATITHTALVPETAALHWFLKSPLCLGPWNRRSAFVPEIGALPPWSLEPQYLPQLQVISNYWICMDIRLDLD